MAKSKCTTALRWILAAFFAFGAVGNVFASETILADYQRWGYPWGFNYVTGLVELASSALLITRFRLQGALLGSAVMAAAAGTVVLHGELLHSIAPLVVLSLSSLLAVAVMKTTAQD